MYSTEIVVNLLSKEPFGNVSLIQNLVASNRVGVMKVEQSIGLSCHPTNGRERIRTKSGSLSIQNSRRLSNQHHPSFLLTSLISCWPL